MIPGSQHEEVRGGKQQGGEQSGTDLACTGTQGRIDLVPLWMRGGLLGWLL